MIVYMTRRHRRALQGLIEEAFGERPKGGSRAILRAALEYLYSCIDQGYCDCDSGGGHGCLDAEMELADDFVTRLLDAHRRWPSSLRELRTAHRARKRSHTETHAPAAEVASMRRTTTVTYRQTSHERCETDVNERARDAIRALGVPILDNWGGCWIGPNTPLLCADEGFELDATPFQVEDIRRALAGIVGNPETIQVTTRPCGIDCRDDEVVAEMRAADGN
jgi:hypothetical protein